MTLALRILKLLADKKVRTREQIAEELNADSDQVHNSLIYLRTQEMTEFAHVYVLTEKGHERSKFQRKQYVRKRPERPYVRKVAVTPAPALAQVWRQA